MRQGTPEVTGAGSTCSPTVEGLIREAITAGYNGSIRRLHRYARQYVTAVRAESFVNWLSYNDPTGNTAVSNVMREARA